MGWRVGGLRRVGLFLIREGWIGWATGLGEWNGIAVVVFGY